jgi:MarR family transcriptional regulator, transcriptional regulator for hemolysin
MAAERNQKPRRLRLGFLLHDVSRLRRTVFDKAFKPLGVTRSQWWVLANLSRHSGTPMMQTELARVLDVGKVALGSLLDRLEANGLVVRIADRQDRRVKMIKITPTGDTLLSQIEQRAAQLNGEMLKDITADEILMVEDLLHRMKQRLVQMDHETRTPDNSSEAFQSVHPPEI